MMSSSDAIIWNIEKDPQLQSTIMAVWLLDEEPTPERMAQNVDRMVAAIPRLRQRVQPGRPRPSWDPLDAGELDLAHHYVAQSMAPGSDFSAVLDFAQTWVREPFDRTRPLWRLALLTGLAGGKAAIVIKVHHAIADGMGMVLMLGAFTDFERHPVAMPIGDSVVELPPAETCTRRPSDWRHASVEPLDPSGVRRLLRSHRALAPLARPFDSSPRTARRTAG